MVEDEKIWTVQLGADHVAYPAVHFRRGQAHMSSYTVLLVDIKRFMVCFERDDLTLEHASLWSEEARRGVREFLDPNPDLGRPPEMPVVGLRFKTRIQRRCWGLFPSRDVMVPVVSFQNGRHRARYVEYAGALTMPVEVHDSEAESLRNYCGA
jgi:hypothetical protein